MHAKQASSSKAGSVYYGSTVLSVSASPFCNSTPFRLRCQMIVAWKHSPVHLWNPICCCQLFWPLIAELTCVHNLSCVWDRSFRVTNERRDPIVFDIKELLCSGVIIRRSRMSNNEGDIVRRTDLPRNQFIIDTKFTDDLIWLKGEWRGANVYETFISGIYQQELPWSKEEIFVECSNKGTLWEEPHW